jgi:hypothetical protein
MFGVLRGVRRDASRLYMENLTNIINYKIKAAVYSTAA